MSFTFFDGSHIQSGFKVGDLFALINDATASAKAKILNLKNQRSSISIGDMFEMQMLMNHLSQLSEMTTGVVSASNAAIMKMAGAIRG